MTHTAIRIEELGKKYRLGETHEHTLSDLVAAFARRLAGRRPKTVQAPEDFWALREVELEIQEGEAVGIIGGNGAGKSTLLKILSRITQPTTGRALVRGRMSSLLEVGTGFHKELTGRENVYLNGAVLGMRRAEVARKFDEIVAFSGVGKFIDTPVKRYSSGMYVRLAFAVAAHLEPDVLVIDEVLAVGDAEFQQRCLGKMGEVAREGRTVVFVSHNMAAIQKLCGRAIWLAAGRVAAVGEPAHVIGDYLATVAGAHGDHERPGFLYHSVPTESESRDAYVQSVQILDSKGSAAAHVATGQDVRIRIVFAVRRSFRSFSAVLQVSTADGVTLILTSSTPDQNVSFGVEPGVHAIECSFDAFPLAAGEYQLGVGLAIPGVEYVWREDRLSRLRVQAADVYASGLPPDARRYLVATAHRWQTPESVSKSTELFGVV